MGERNWNRLRIAESRDSREARPGRRYGRQWRDYNLGERVNNLCVPLSLSLSQFKDSLVTSRTVEARSGEAEEEDVDIEAGPRY